MLWHILGDFSIDDGIFKVGHMLELFLTVLYDDRSHLIGPYQVCLLVINLSV